MAWITPVTDRSGPETMTTAADMNRIGGNLNVLTGGNFKDDYTDTDIVLKTDWLELIETVQFWDSNITTDTTWTNFNLIEQTILSAYNGGVIPSNSLYPRETLFPTDE